LPVYKYRTFACVDEESANRYSKGNAEMMRPTSRVLESTKERGAAAFPKIA
jgi:hypothetical protein